MLLTLIFMHVRWGRAFALCSCAYVHTGKDALGKQIPCTKDERDVKGTDHAHSQLVHQVLVFMGTWCAMATQSSPVGSVGSLLSELS